MPILAIDYGERKVGLAISDDKNKMALPLSIIQNQGDRNLVLAIKKLCLENNINHLVVGLPLTLASRETDFKNKHTQKVLKFIELLKKQIKVPVDTEDERFSTKMANGLYAKEIKIKGEDDAVAASLILQSYLDKNY